MMKHLMPFDEVNRLEDELILSTYEQDGVKRSRKDREECIDLVWDLLVLAYMNGFEAVAEEFGIDIDILGIGGQMNEAIFKQFDGKDFRDRIGEYYDSGDYEAINRVIETDAHRVYNDAVQNAADTVVVEKPDTVLYKRWNTMLDDRVRDTHDFLEGVRVPVTEKFYTSDGDSAMYPGDFENPANNCGCRCLIDIESA